MRVAAASIILSLLTTVASVTSPDTETKPLAVYCPLPYYPSLPDGRKPEGSGWFVMRVDPKTGVVRSVSIQKSTGFAILDKAAIDALKKWRFLPGHEKVKTPITFTAHGAHY